MNKFYPLIVCDSSISFPLTDFFLRKLNRKPSPSFFVKSVLITFEETYAGLKSKTYRMSLYPAEVLILSCKQIIESWHFSKLTQTATLM